MCVRLFAKEYRDCTCVFFFFSLDYFLLISYHLFELVFTSVYGNSARPCSPKFGKRIGKPTGEACWPTGETLCHRKPLVWRPAGSLPPRWRKHRIANSSRHTCNQTPIFEIPMYSNWTVEWRTWLVSSGRIRRSACFGKRSGRVKSTSSTPSKAE